MLRGFAVLGILLGNSPSMAGLHLEPGGDPAAPGADVAAEWLVAVLASNKFYVLFSFLFGYSFTLQRSSAERAEASFAARQLRRLSCLFLLGLAHGVLLFSGDILMSYAVLSLPLFAVRNIAPRTAVRVAAGLIAFTAACLLVWGLLILTATEPAAAQSGTTAAAREWVAARRGDAGSVIDTNLRSLRAALPWNVLYGADIFAAFLVGVAAGRLGLLNGTGRLRAQPARILLVGLPLGVAGGVFTAICRKGPLDSRWYDIGSAVSVLTAPALMAAYACGVLLLLRTEPGRRCAGVLATAGRLSLTHYLTQSLVTAWVFTGYGLARYGCHGAAAVTAGCLALYAAQLALGTWLLGRFRYGPAEWLLRTATLARRP